MFRFLDVLRGQAFAPAQPPKAAAQRPQQALPLPPWLAWMVDPARKAEPGVPVSSDYAQQWAEPIEESKVARVRADLGEDLAGLRGKVEEHEGPVFSHTLGKGVKLGEEPEAEGALTERWSVDPSSGTLSLQRIRKIGEEKGPGSETASRLDIGKSSVAGEIKASDTDADGTKQGFSAGGGYDWDKHQLSAKGSISRETVEPRATKEGGGAASDYSASGAVKVGPQGIAVSGAYSHGAGDGRRGGSLGIDTIEGSVSAGYVRGDLAAGATVYGDGAAVQASYGGVGGGFMVRHDDERTALGANVALSKEFGVGATVAWGDDEWYAGGNVTYLGVGVGAGYGETSGKTSRKDDGDRASTTVEDGTVLNGSVSAVVASGEGARTTRHRSTVSAAKPADFDSWSPEQQRAWRARIDDQAHGVRQAEDLDLDAMAVSSGHSFDDASSLSGRAKVDVDFIPGQGAHAHIAGASADRSSLSVARTGEDTFDVDETRSHASSSDMGAEGKMFFGALKAKGNRKVEHAEETELGYRLTTDAAKESFEKLRLAGGLLPGAERHQAYAELRRLEAGGGTFVERARMEELRERINADVRAEAKVGSALADGTLVTRKARSTHDGKDTETDNRFLFWGGRSKVKTASDTTEIDSLDDDGTIDHTEIEKRSRQEGNHEAESVAATTTTDDDGPALAFHTSQIVTGAGHITTAQTAGVADVLPGESSFKGERVVDTSISLSRGEARRIAAIYNAPGSDHWGRLAARVSEYTEENGFMKIMLGVPEGVRSAEDFKRLKPAQQRAWLKALETASAGEKGNVFEAVAAIELIADPERKRQAYEDLVTWNHDDKRLEDKDLGAEYLAFAASIKADSKGAVDLAAGAATTTDTDDHGVAGKLDADKAGRMMTDFVAILDPGRITATLDACYRSGGPELVAQAVAKGKLDPVEVYRRVGDDPRQMQALLEATDGTAFGARLQNVMAQGARLGGPDAADGGFGRMMLDVAARRPVQVDAGAVAPPQDVDERRGRSLARNLHIPGTGDVIAATLIEARRQGGDEAVRAALEDAGGLSVGEVIERLEANGDGGGAWRLRWTLGVWQKA